MKSRTCREDIQAANKMSAKSNNNHVTRRRKTQDSRRDGRGRNDMTKHKRLFGKLSSLVLAAAMAIAMVFTATPAFAASTTSHTITINKADGDTVDHNYEAYQVFAGDYASGVLSNVTWGEGVDSTGLLTALKADATVGTKFTGCTTAADVAKAMEGINNDSDEAKAIAEVISAHLSTTKAATGASPLTVTGDGYYFVKDADTADTGNTAKTRYILQVVGDVTVKAKSSVPTVEKKVKEKNDTTGQETGWQDAADYDIGDEIPYQITGTLPSTFADYKTYKTYTFTDTLSNGLDITADQLKAITVKVGETDVTSHFDIAYSNHVLTVSLKENEDLKTWTTPALTADSKIVVNYSATLTKDAVIGSAGNPNEVNLTYSNNPNAGGDGDHGKTPDDKVTVFTYEIEAQKVGEDGTTPLEGAGFTLYKKGSDENYTAVGTEIKGVTTFEFKGTDAGEYKLVETTVPAGYNKAEDLIFKVEATYDTTADDPQLKSLTVTPAEAKFTVTTTTKDDGTHITTDGKATTTIKNQKGSTLPSTGGIGTTIFYVLGAILVIGAGIVLFVRRRVSRR